MGHSHVTSSWSFQMVNVLPSAFTSQFWDNSWAGVLGKAHGVTPGYSTARTVVFKAGCMLSQRVGIGQDTPRKQLVLENKVGPLL